MKREKERTENEDATRQRTCRKTREKRQREREERVTEMEGRYGKRAKLRRDRGKLERNGRVEENEKT